MPRVILLLIGSTLAVSSAHAQDGAQNQSIAVAAASPQAPAIPEAVRRMLEAALASGKDDEVAMIAKYAINTNPGVTDQVQAMVDAYHSNKEAVRRATIEEASMFSLWEGKIELGGFSSTGSTEEVGISGSLSAKRQGLKWTHALAANVDYRRANGRRSAERVLASYTPNYYFDRRNFIYGLLQFERDPVVGYDARYTGSAGIGYSFIANRNITLSTTLGPSLRRTKYSEDGAETKFGARSSLDFKWALSPTLTLQQTASAYAERDTASISSLTALDTRIISKLTARLSYTMRYESGSRLTERTLDTTSKVTFIYGF